MIGRASILLTGLWILGAFSTALAQEECDTNEDCPEGLLCEVVGASACLDITCPAGEPCPDIPPCEEETFSACVPGPCMEDSDCGDDLECITVSYDECDAPVARPDCGPDTDCGPVDYTEPTCEAHSESFCAPSYVGPCATNEECGDGFDCVQAEECSCSGGGSVPPSATPSGSGGGTPSSGGGADDPDDGGDPMDPDGPVDPDGPPPEDGCECRPSDDFYCQPQEITCDDDSVCPDGWSCETRESPVACVSSSDGETHCDEPEPSESTCVPPYWDHGFAASDDGSREALNLASGSEGTRATQRPEDPSVGDELIGDEAGCSAVPGSRGGMPAIALLILGLVALRRRY